MSERLTRVQRDVMTEASREIGIMPTHAKGVTLDALEARGLIRAYPSNGAMAHKYALTLTGWAAIGVTPPSDLARRGAIGDATYGRTMHLHPSDRTPVEQPAPEQPRPGLAVLSEMLGGIISTAMAASEQGPAPERESIEQPREVDSETPEQPAQMARTGRSMARGHRDTRRAARRVQRAARRANRKR